MTNHFEIGSQLRSEFLRAERQKCETSVEIDTEKYQKMIDDPSLNDSQRKQIVESLWLIIVSFVDLGFGVHPADQTCGKLDEIVDPRRSSRI